MMNIILKAAVIVSCLVFGSANAGAERLPADVARYVERREGCDHFRGEVPDPPDARRMKEITREIRKLCKGTDQQLDKLKRKYANDPSVSKRLDEFEENIETSPSTSR